MYALETLSMFSAVFLGNFVLLPIEALVWLFKVLQLLPYILFIQFDYWLVQYEIIKDKLILVSDFVILDYERFKEEYKNNFLLYTGFYVTWPVYLAYWGILYTL